jgi:hypothetical protein
MAAGMKMTVFWVVVLSTSETSLSFYETTRRNISEDSLLQKFTYFGTTVINKNYIHEEIKNGLNACYHSAKYKRQCITKK